MAYVSASEIVGLLAAGHAHMGITGEDLVRETVETADAKLELLAPLGFGSANVVVAVPQAWIDVRTMADPRGCRGGLLYQARRANAGGDEIRSTSRGASSPTTMSPTIASLVESLGATEGAPAGRPGRTDRRHHHDGRDALRQRVESAGMMA